jgi:hypothetical protein
MINWSFWYTKLDFNWSQYLLLTPPLGMPKFDLNWLQYILLMAPLGMPKFDIKWFTRFITIAFICDAQI